MKVAKVRIENFRGIRHPLELEFKKGSRFTSVAVYGRNGNGKSSIVDSWEWLYSDQHKIEHLAREGAAEREFPHKASGGVDCYIEVEFEGEDNSIRKDYNRQKVRHPLISGAYQAFKGKAPHPCHLRYRDLQTFVYQTKSERYRYLARYLGFEQQLTIQENLITERNKLKQLEIQLADTLHQSLERTKSLLEVDELDDIEKSIIQKVNEISVFYSFDPIVQIASVVRIKSRLEKLIQDDPNAIQLTSLKSYKNKLSKFKVIVSLEADLKGLAELLVSIKENEANVSKLILLKLYKNGLDILEKDNNICPLCDTTFNSEETLYNHIESKYHSLSSLKEQREEFIKEKRRVLQRTQHLVKSLENLLESNDLDSRHKRFYALVGLLKVDYESMVSALSKNMEDIKMIPSYHESLITRELEINRRYQENLTSIEEEIKHLEENETRQKLANDFETINKLVACYERYVESSTAHAYFRSQKEEFDQVDELYSGWMKAGIQASFDQISGNVVKYFNVLESSNKNITNPKITLLVDKDKAVELEIEFANKPIHPAFKVLSESQINSFGLAVFLAAIRQFNTDFKFVLLDDVVNSFDAYKRPKVIDLLKLYFSDFQILILTHDSIWFDRLQRTFPSWNRVKFTGWDYNTGPKIKAGKSIFEEVEFQLQEDNPILAGQLLGRYLEWTLQEFNQNFETPIRYKFDNQYTLGELFDAFQGRISKKLKSKHKLTGLVKLFSENTSFRNYCAHYKSPETEYTKEEISDIFAAWKKIEDMMTCEECLGFTILVKPQGYVRCRCSKLDLLVEKYYEVDE